MIGLLLNTLALIITAFNCNVTFTPFASPVHQIAPLVASSIVYVVLTSLVGCSYINNLFSMSIFNLLVTSALSDTTRSTVADFISPTKQSPHPLKQRGLRRGADGSINLTDAPINLPASDSRSSDYMTLNDIPIDH